MKLFQDLFHSMHSLSSNQQSREERVSYAESWFYFKVPLQYYSLSVLRHTMTLTSVFHFILMKCFHSILTKCLLSSLEVYNSV